MLLDRVGDRLRREGGSLHCVPCGGTQLCLVPGMRRTFLFGGAVRAVKNDVFQEPRPWSDSVGMKRRTGTLRWGSGGAPFSSRPWASWHERDRPHGRGAGRLLTQPASRPSALAWELPPARPSPGGSSHAQ